MSDQTTTKRINGARRLSRHAKVLAGGGPADLMAGRIEQDAENILENALHRRRWIVADRDAVAAIIANAVRRELRLAENHRLMG